MFFIPGEIIAILTFPGIIVHEMAHLLFCKFRKMAVLDVVYFRIGNPAGYVIHEKTDNFTSTFLVSMGPFFINTLLCLLICLPAYMPMKFFNIDHPLSYVLMWLGISIGMHAIPSSQDADNVYEQAKERIKDGNLLAIISFPIVGLVYLFNILRVIWSDAIYAFAIGVGIPSLIFG